MIDIDAVVTWVDGKDPALREKRYEYGDMEVLTDDEIAGDVRYDSFGEIRWCVASLLRFAPWLRRIHIVTDGQDPHLEDMVKEKFPASETEIVIVDHKDIFRGMERLLPVFNSRSIETLMWRIPGLSERFIYLNDDFMLVFPVTPEDFFDGDDIICYGRWFRTDFARFVRKVKPRANGHVKASFRDSMARAACILGEKQFVRLGHTPHALKVSIYRDFYAQHPDIVEYNASFRFRSKEQYSVPELAYLLEKQAGRLIVRPTKGNMLYLKPHGHKYMMNHLRRFENSTSEKFCCVNSLSYASEDDRKAVFDWLDRRIFNFSGEL